MMAHILNVPWENISIGVAALLTLIYIVRIMRGTLRDTMDGVTARQTEMLQWFGNHLSNISSSLEGSALAIQKVVDKLDVLHDDAINAANALIEQDELVREEMEERRVEHERIASEVRYLRVAALGVRAEGDVEQRHEGERGNP